MLLYVIKIKGSYGFPLAQESCNKFSIFIDDISSPIFPVWGGFQSLLKGKRTLTEEKTKEESKQCSQSQSYNEVRTDVQLSPLAAKKPKKKNPNLFTRGCHSGLACMYELAGFRPDALPAATKKGFVSSQDWTRDLLLVKWKCKLKYKIVLYKNSWWILYRLLCLNKNLFFNGSILHWNFKSDIDYCNCFHQPFHSCFFLINIVCVGKIWQYVVLHSRHD